MGELLLVTHRPLFFGYVTFEKKNVSGYTHRYLYHGYVTLEMRNLWIQNSLPTGINFQNDDLNLDKLYLYT